MYRFEIPIDKLVSYYEFLSQDSALLGSAFLSYMKLFMELYKPILDKLLLWTRSGLPLRICGMSVPQLKLGKLHSYYQ